uniref:Uncharacterized protein n=1 Tax=Onchocerca volvulus TaxID=6282 RepID=A0A8R1TWH8_ONCVO
MLQLCNNHKQGEQKGEEHFWNKPLGAWIKDCIIGSDALLPEATWRIQAYHGRALQFSELCDGFVFSLLFVLVEPDTLNLIIMREGENSISDTANSLKRLSILLQNIWKFYRVSLLNKFAFKQVSKQSFKFEFEQIAFNVLQQSFNLPLSNL